MPIPLDELVAGFVYYNREDEDYHRKLCKLIDRTPAPILGEPAWVIELEDGSQRYATSEQLRPWYLPLGEDMEFDWSLD